MSTDENRDSFGTGVFAGVFFTGIVVMVFLIVLGVTGQLRGEADFERRYCTDFRPNFVLHENGRWECVEATDD